MSHAIPVSRSSWSLPRGRVLVRALRNDPMQDYLIYVPESAKRGSPVLVSVHGVSGNAREQAGVFAKLCDAHGVVLLVPVFNQEQHKGYQRLGRRGRSNRADLLLQRFLVEVTSLCGADVAQVYLFGFSAGAQFAHRYLMAHPHRVSRAVVAAAGWYTMPTNDRPFPYGIRPNRRLAGVSFNPEAFLRVPVEVLIGTEDVGSNKVRSTERLDAQQGKTRLERARRWVEAMRAAAQAHGLPPRTQLSEVLGIGHSFREFCDRGELVRRVERALFASSAGDALVQAPAEPPLERAAAEPGG